MRLRAVEPGDVSQMYTWENDPAIWSVSGTTEPFSHHMIERFVETQKRDIFESRQQRLMIETLAAQKTVGALDLYDFDPLEGRAGVGILIYDLENRGKGYASDAITIACNYACRTLRMHQLWCSVGAENQASLALFRHAGFEQTGIRRDWHWTPEGYVDEILMQKML